MYHGSFAGDTYDACARCGGKCEKFKISTLMPGEKEFMAEKLGLTLTQLEEQYLSEINTPYGNVDVLKLKNDCNFLDQEYKCTAIPAKPVLCDTYPVVFYISKNKVHFEIDKADCPMVHWPEYKLAVKNFEINGIRAIKEMRIPFVWWKKVALFDEFDFDYFRIEKEKARTKGYEEFYLEDILGYACNGYEKKARQKGLELMINRLMNFKTKSGKQIIKWTNDKSYYQKSIAKMYYNLIKEQCNTMISFLKAYKNDGRLIAETTNDNYLDAIREARKLMEQLEAHLISFKSRLNEVFILEQRKLKRSSASLPIGKINEAYKVGFPEDAPELSYYEITNQGTREFWQAIALLSGTFFPNELDSPKTYYEFIKTDLGADEVTHYNKNIARKNNTWSRWIILIAKDKHGKMVGVADGALIMNSKLSVFYASHIATWPQIRSKGLGTLLSAAILQAAENNIPSGRAALGLPVDPASSEGPLITGELGEVEFPDTSISGISSIKRLPFHGRLGRKALWPFRYAQPDTNYAKRTFEKSLWNSVPMFLAYRSFSNANNTVQKAIDAAELLYSYFSANMGRGVEFDREFMDLGLKKDGPPSLIQFPTRKDEVPEFIGKTGLFKDILKIYYPDHKFTLDLFKQ